MAGQARPSGLHFLVFVLCISSRCFQVHGLQDFLGSCGLTIDLLMTVNVQSGILRMPMPESMDRFQDPTKPINCDITVTFTSGMNLLVELYFLDIMPLSGDVKACSTGLEIFDQTNRKYYGSRLCMEGWQWEERHRQKNQEKVLVMNSPLIFRLVSGGPYRGEGFRVHFNQIRPTWPCYTREFRCREIQRCVHDELTCDGWDDCGDYSDERMEAGCRLLTASEICALIMGVILLLGAAGMVVVFIIIYRRMSLTYGVKSESKVPIADDKYSMDSVQLGGRYHLGGKYNSQDSLPSKYSRSTAHNRRDSDSDTIDKVDLERAERMSNKTGDNMSERSIRSNPRKNLLQNLGNEVQPDPVKKSGQYSYGGRKSRTSSQSSLNRDKNELTNGNADTANQDGREKDRFGSKDRLSEKGRDRNSLDRKSDRNRDRYSDSDDYSDDRDRYDDRRRRRRSRERDRRRDDEYSDDDSDYNSKRRRRRSYDRYSDDSDYEYERERDRRRRSKERRSRSRHDDDDSSESDRNKAPDDKKDIDRPHRGGSRDRDRDRGRRSRGRYDDDDSDRDRYQDLQDEKDSGRNPRRSSRERDRDRYRDSYDEDRDRRKSRRDDDDDDYRYSERKRSRERRRGPSSERDKLKDAPSRSRENISARERDEKSSALPLPPPYSEEDPNHKPPRDAIPPAGNKRYPEKQNQQAAPQNPSQYAEPQRTPKPPPSSEDIRRAEQQNQKSPPPPSDTKYREPQVPKPSGPDARQGQSQKQPPKEVDETDRRRSTDNRRERYSRNRWTPKQKSEDLPPPDYEDVTPKSTYVGIAYKEESV